MSLLSFATVGKGEFLARLRGDLRRARQSLTIVGPWMDVYFAEEVSRAVTADDLQVRVLTRPPSAMEPDVWAMVQAALNRFQTRFPAMEARTLERLHAKVVLVDETHVFLGSTNFYRYSLDESHELGLCGPAAAAEGLVRELRRLMDQGTPLSLTLGPGTASARDQEILNPIVREILAKNPKARIVGRRPAPGPRGD